MSAKVGSFTTSKVVVRALLCASMSAFPQAMLAQAAPVPVASENVNMVSGITWPGGDPFLQRQNEPSLAVSSANRLHLLGSANDYRTVDIPGLPGVSKFPAEAWVGVFRSLDGGQTWSSKLLPGYPQQNTGLLTDPEGYPNVLQNYSPTGATPFFRFNAACDGNVRAGIDGLLYVSGMAFNRDTKEAVTFVARFLDDGSNLDPIKYLDTKVVAFSGTGNQAVLVDRPALAVDLPRKKRVDNNWVDPPTCTVGGKTLAAGRVYQAYARFNDPTGASFSSQIEVSYSSDCGATWTMAPRLGDPTQINQGAALAVDPFDGTLWLTWRRFNDPSKPDSAPDAILVARSVDGGQTFRPQKGLVVADNIPVFDISPTTGNFRTEVIPTIAVSVQADGGRYVHVAWTQRDAQTGDGRVVMSTSDIQHVSHDYADEWDLNSETWQMVQGWTPPAPVDPPVPSDGMPYARSHQFMPALTFSQGRLALVYYDTRFDSTRRYIDLNTFRESVAPVGLLEANDHDPSTIFDSKYTPGASLQNQPLTDPPPYTFNSSQDPAQWTPLRWPWTYRHSTEVRVATALPGAPPVFTSSRVSKLPYGVQTEPPPNPPVGPDDPLFLITSWVPSFDPMGIYLKDEAGNVKTFAQSKANFPNLPLFRNGTTPFLGDFIDIAATMYVPTPPSGRYPYGWKPNIEWTSSPVFHAVWTTNQDVHFPADGDFRKYTPVKLRSDQSTSVFTGGDPTAPSPTFCQANDDHTGTRNQNIYSARISEGLYVHSPEAVKTLSPTVTRSFMIAAQNFTSGPVHVRYCVADSTGTCLTSSVAGLTATFQNDFTAAPVLTADGFAQKDATSSQTLFVRGSGLATLYVTACELDTATGSCKVGGSSGTVTLNPPGATPPLRDPSSGETVIPVFLPFDPTTDIKNLQVDQMNPQAMNPQAMNPQAMNPQAMNPQAMNPQAMNPQATAVVETWVSEATYLLQNTGPKGDTAATYVISVEGYDQDGPPIYIRTAKIETVGVADGCTILGELKETLIAKGIVGQTENIIVTALPGETVAIVLGANVQAPQFAAMTDQFTVTATAQGGGASSTLSAQPLQIITSRLADQEPTAFSGAVTARGGEGPYTWSVARVTRLDGTEFKEWSLGFGNPQTPATIGVLTGTFADGGTFLVYVTATDGSSPQASVTRGILVKVRKPTTTGLNASPEASSPWLFGEPVRFTATVTPSDAVGVVTFLDGGATVGTCEIKAGDGGRCSNSVASFTVGSHPITAQYAGSADFVGSTSPVVTNEVRYRTSLRVATDTTYPSTGAPTKLNANVSVVLPEGTPAPAEMPLLQGTVKFYYDGSATSFGECAISAGSCSVSVSFTFPAPGTHTVQAIYTAGASYASSQRELTVFVKYPTSSVLSAGTPSPSDPGQSVSFTFTVQPADLGAATGSVELLEGTTTYAGCALTPESGNTCTLTTNLLGPGSHSLTASYLGTVERFDGSVSTPVTQNVRYPSSTAAEVSPASPVATGTSTTFTANVSAIGSTGTGLPAPTGTVTFTDSVVDAGGVLPTWTCDLGVGGACSVSRALDPGLHYVSVSYGGSPATPATADWYASSAVATSSVSPATPIRYVVLYPTVTTLSTLTATTIDTAVTFGATVASGTTPPAGTPALSGQVTVNVTSNSDSLYLWSCSFALPATACSAAWVPKLSGWYSVTATYGGDGLRAASPPSTSLQLVKWVPSVAVEASPAQSVPTEGIRIDVTVDGGAVTSDVSQTAVVPAGTVAVKDETNTSRGSCTISDGKCSVTIPVSSATGRVPLTAGQHTFTATFTPDATVPPYYVADSGSARQYVKFASSTTAGTTVNADGSITFSAVVVPGANGSVTPRNLPSGSVSFNVDGVSTPFASCTFSAPDRGCSARFDDPSVLGVGPYVIRATYVPTTGLDLATYDMFAPSSGVTNAFKWPTRTTLSQDSSSTMQGKPVTFTATVTADDFDRQGTVTFYDNGSNVIGSCQPTTPPATAPAAPVIAGSCSVSYSNLAAGVPHLITATYEGDSIFASSASGAVSHSVWKYTFTGFGKPLLKAGDGDNPTNSGNVKMGPNLTVKWLVQDASGAYLTSPEGMEIQVWTWVNGRRLQQVVYATNANGLLKYDTQAKQFTYTWATSTVTTGVGWYEILVKLPDQARYGTLVQLTLK